MKASKLAFLVLFLLFFKGFQLVQAQNNTSAWINHNQTYYKIPSVQTGIYRITQAELANAGIAGINPKAIQIFHRGVEQAIFVQGESDNILDSGDYVEFYGIRNDGKLDFDLYNTGRHLNVHYNLFSDTTAYFLTWKIDGTFGKRMSESNLPFNNTNLEKYHWQEELQFFSEAFNTGQNYNQGNEQLYDAKFDVGEGWLSNSIATNASRNFTFATSNIYTPPSGSIVPKLEIRLAGTVENSDYTVEIRVGNSTSSLRLLGTYTRSSHAMLDLSSSTALNLLSSDIAGTGNFIVQARCTKGNFGVVSIRLLYPQTFTVTNTSSKYFGLPKNISNTSHIEISNPPANAIIYDITDTNNIIRIASNLENGKLQASVANTASLERKLFVHNQTNLAALKIEPVTFQNINPSSYNYLIITNKKLRKPAGNYADVVQGYADYRASQAGGSFNPLVMEMDVLYNQFSYGERTPLAIKSFARFMLSNGGNPKYVFLIGKGASLPDQYNDLNIRKNANQMNTYDLVPTYGFPPSDFALVSGLENNANAVEPTIPIGRISAISPLEVLSYLDKVKEHESEGAQLWQKNILHLTGGNTEQEQNLFKIYGQQFAQVAEGVCYNAIVNSASKSTTSTVELINISEFVNRGVGLVTFFGHSSLTITDLEVGFVSDDIQGYRNKGKYPVMLANGCQLAGVFYSSKTLSEDWMFTRDRGAIAFIGHCYFGYSNPLRDYTQRFYNKAFKDQNWIGKPIGDLLKEHIRSSVTSSSTTADKTTAQQMILQGDPAVRFIKVDKPDYEITNNQISIASFDNSPVTAVSDSFKLNIVVSNVGLSCNAKPFKIRVIRTYSNGITSTFNGTIAYPVVGYQSTVSFTIRREEGFNAYGNNQFEVMVDYENTTTEANEDNNIAFAQFFIPTFGVLPILPKEYAIANEQPIVLTALASNLTDENRPFIFEIDTTRNFNSPVKQTSIVTAEGISANWNVTLPSDNNQDSTVYYWRVNYADALNDANVLWGESSFVYIKNSPEGWSQSRFPQFSKASLTNIKRNTSTQKWEFTSLDKSIEVNTFGNTSDGNYQSDVVMKFQGQPIVFDGRCNLINGTYQDNIVAMAFDQTTGDPYLVFQAQSCGRTPFIANYYSQAQIQNNNALQSYLDAVPNGDWVLFFNAGNIPFTTWTTTMKSAFAQIGGNPNIYNTLQNGHPYAILGRKGFGANTATEAIASSIANPTGDFINLRANVVVPYTNGQILSTRIGPAEKWKELIYNIKETQGDSFQIDVLGINLQGQVSPNPILTNVTTPQTSLANIDANQFPYLQLRMSTTDTQQKTPAQLNKWLVIFDGSPEGFIDTEAVGQSAYNITKKQEGQNFELEFAFKNISGISFDADSLTVQFTVTNQTNAQQTVKTAKIKAPAPKETVKFKHTFETVGMPGNNEIKVYVNPQLVAEQYYENNILLVNFEVQKDNANPTLEVAFDGRRISDGEIVSPNPIISIALRDNNRYLLPKDPSGLIVELKKPCDGCVFEQYNLNLSNVSYTTANEILQVNIQEANLENGIYTLRTQGQDVAGNRAGSVPYQINFEVVRESTVTNFFPYPNPFSTSTRFVFTLTGGQIPDEIKIQIMTVSGKVIREITQTEIGAIRIGQNMTEYAWDGTDEFGDKLANGVYLYRVLMKANGQNIDHRATSADKGFKNGFGKLYITR